MGKIDITIATWDYDRVRPLIDGRVAVEGCTINYLPMTVEECFHRAFFHGEFDVSEIGFSPYIIACARGVVPYRALPVFLSRTFRHSSIYIRTDRGIVTAADLRGKRIGVPEYQQSAALWTRGTMHDDYGVGYDEVSWVQGGLEQYGRTDKFALNLPAGFPLEGAPEGKSLSALLAAGEIDAVISARPPSCYIAGAAGITRLFEDFKTAERDYYARTGIFPIMHALGVRNDVADRHPWLASSLYKAFREAKSIADRDLREVTALKIGLPWLIHEMAETEALMGADFWPYGIEPNRTTLEKMALYSYEQGLSVRKVSVEELFVASTVDDVKV